MLDLWEHQSNFVALMRQKKKLLIWMLLFCMNTQIGGAYLIISITDSFKTGKCPKKNKAFSQYDFSCQFHSFFSFSFLFFFFSFCIHGIWKFPEQGLNLSQSSGNAGSFTHCTTARTPIFFFFFSNQGIADLRSLHFWS